MDLDLGDMSHLIDDSVFGDMTLAAKEHLKAREVNKREERILKSSSRLIDRAQFVARRSHDHEINVLRKSLVDIHTKTPNFKATTAQRQDIVNVRKNAFKMIHVGNDGTSHMMIHGPTFKEKRPRLLIAKTVQRSNSLPALENEEKCKSNTGNYEMQSKDIRSISEGNLGSLSDSHVDLNIKDVLDSDSNSLSERQNSVRSTKENWLVNKIVKSQNKTIQKPTLFLPPVAQRNTDQVDLDVNTSKPQSHDTLHSGSTIGRDGKIKHSTRQILMRASHVSKHLDNIYNQRKLGQYPKLPSINDYGLKGGDKMTSAEFILHTNAYRQRLMFPDNGESH